MLSVFMPDPNCPCFNYFGAHSGEVLLIISVHIVIHGKSKGLDASLDLEIPDLHFLYCSVKQVLH